MSDATTILAEQLRHQLAVSRVRMTRWIPWIFVAGFVISVLGFIASLIEFRDGDSLSGIDFVFALFTLMFGWAVFQLFLGPFTKPRIVPYFAREIGEYGGSAMAAFTRGRAVYVEIAALDVLAAKLGVRPLSLFGFTYDYYEQEVRWHSAADGVQTAEALRTALASHRLMTPEMDKDLQALASVLRIAAEQRVDFSLVLRMFAREDMQGVRTLETRQGEFW